MKKNVGDEKKDYKEADVCLTTTELDIDSQIDQDMDDGTEMFEHFRIVVDKGQTLERIDKFLVDRLQRTARSRIQTAAKAGNILVNEIAVKPNYKVKPSDIISIVLPHPPRETEMVPENIPIDVVYEDDDVMVINKAAGMVVHPGYGNFTGTLVQALMYHVGAKVFLVHRIDKDTSGLILVAKNELAQTGLAKQFFDHTVERKYYALVWGDFNESEGRIEGSIARSIRDRRVMTVYTDGVTGKEAVTHYHVEERYGYVTLVSCVLETGRTHQIRCHMRYIKHPLFGDITYGGDQILKGTTFSKYKQFVQNCFEILPRQALHAATLGFTHPITHEKMRFSCDIAEDMGKVLYKWKNYAKVKGFEEKEEITTEDKIERGRLLNENK